MLWYHCLYDYLWEPEISSVNHFTLQADNIVVDIIYYVTVLVYVHFIIAF